ncbi:pentapeptide repeat-containing protein [Pseudarthrobacter equi]|uniref:pentapeptide repeat-containing protein n=1 Tax=Pseudarthrobacter TaxID=1742993 RepID=UPI0015851E00|nr:MULTISPECIES: pentapeptide repeat-containing protein [Pseudarthrobacter]MCT9625947.1 pentapeptide repeat-containing protein [Pseudarthrobacter equi]NUT72116.1 pentapeptide repeat-containing protein [Pseudarthrobacter sp. C4D7]
MDESALRALRAGTGPWSRFRAYRNSEDRLDLTGARLAGANLSGEDLSNVDLSGADLTGTNLASVSLEYANLTGANLRSANLTGAILYRANLTDTKLTGAVLTRAELGRANLTGADLASADFSASDLGRANLTQAFSPQADYTAADLHGAIFTGANLTESKLIHTTLSEAVLTRADLTGADFSDAILIGADLSHAQLLDANFARATFDDKGLQAPPLHDRANAEAEFLEPGAIRLQSDLPPNADPEVLARFAASAAVIARLASQVGSQLERSLFGEPSPETNRGVLVTTTEADTAVIRISRAHYGSPWWMDLIETVPPAVQGAAVTAAGSTAAFLLRKRSQGLLSLLLTLARRQEREPYMEERVLEQQGRLVDRQISNERKGADHAQEQLRRMQAEDAVARYKRLQIEPATEYELEERINEAVTDGEAKAALLKASPDITPLIENGLTVIVSSDDENA